MALTAQHYRNQTKLRVFYLPISAQKLCAFTATESKESTSSPLLFTADVCIGRPAFFAKLHYNISVAVSGANIYLYINESCSK